MQFLQSNYEKVGLANYFYVVLSNLCQRLNWLQNWHVELDNLADSLFNHELRMDISKCQPDQT